MKRVAYEEMVAQFTRVLEKHGFTPADAKDAAVIFAQNSLSGVYSHGLNRFPRVVSYYDTADFLLFSMRCNAPTIGSQTFPNLYPYSETLRPLPYTGKI